VPGELAGHLEDDEFVRPRGELALAPELIELGGDRQQRIRGGLISEVIEFAAAGQCLRASAPQLSPGGPQ
jgi:hypothetical protein